MIYYDDEEGREGGRENGCVEMMMVIVWWRNPKREGKYPHIHTRGDRICSVVRFLRFSVSHSLKH